MNGTAPAPPSLRDAAALAARVALGLDPAPPAAAPAPPVLVGPPPPTPFAWEPPPGFEPVPQDFLLYHPERSEYRAVFGILVDALPLLWVPRGSNDGAVTPALYGLVVQLVEETPVLDPGKVGRTLLARPGQEILVQADHLALRRLIRAALAPEAVGEVWMRPDPDVRLPDGTPHWIVRSGKTFPRKSIKRWGAP